MIASFRWINRSALFCALLTIVLLNSGTSEAIEVSKLDTCECEVSSPALDAGESVVAPYIQMAALAATSPTPEKQGGLGSLSVLITPPAAVGMDAKWQVDGGAFQDSEATLNGLSVGPHTVCFLAVPFYNKPACIQVNIQENATTFATGNYTPQVGGVTVGIQPPEAVAAGAQWSVGTSGFRNSGDTVNGLFVGSFHTINFKPIPGWITPASIKDIQVLADQVEPFTATYIPESGSVSVAISPPAAVSAGAQWQLDGGNFRAPGTLGGVVAGSHTISFKTIPGFSTPPNQTITVRSNQTTSVSGVYEQQTGGISVKLSPAEAIAGGAQWRIDSGIFNDSDGIQNGLTSGAHTLSFANVPGFNKPADKRVVIIPNQLIFETGEYTRQTGGVKVNIAPEIAITAGAQWQIDGGPYRNSGVTVNGLSLGAHTVSFKPLDEYTSPPDQVITVESNKVTEITGTYTPPTGSVTVTIAPQAAIEAGAKWRLDGGVYQDSGTTLTGILTGEHTISFRTTPGFDKPADQTVTIQNGKLSTASGLYVAQTGNLTVTILPQAAADAGAKWRVDGGVLRDSSATVLGLPTGNHTISFTAVNGFATPGNQVVTVSANQTTNVTGNYTTQFGGVTVYIKPDAAINAGAQWQVDQRELQGSGTIANDLSVGTHIIYFKTIEGFSKPQDLTVTVEPNEITEATVTYLSQAGSLTVNILPEAAIEAGAQWQVDGGPMRNSGATVSGLAYGAHTVAFKSVPGFGTPPSRTVNVTADQVATTTGEYAPQTGSLTVNITPVAAVSAGAQWQVDGGAFQNSGATVTALPFGKHTVAFKTVSGFPTPPEKVVFINANQTTVASGDYTLQSGGLKVTLSPAAAVSAGAQWKVDEGPYQNSGSTVNRLSVGTHTVYFKPVNGFPTPEAKTVTVSPNVVTNATGVYGPETGSLRVNITPEQAVSAGAQWQVDGGDFQNSGATVAGLAAGTHTVSFKPAAGFAAPADATVTITAGELTTFSGAYSADTGRVNVSITPSAAVSAGARWRLDGGPEQESDVTLNNVSVGAHTLTFSAVAGFTAPASQSITVVKDQTTQASGVYTESAACCAGGAPVKSLKDAVNLYLGDLSVFLGALLALAALGRLRRFGA